MHINYALVIISGMQDCVVPYIDIICHTGRF